MVTAPAVVTAGAPQWSMRRQVALSWGMVGERRLVVGHDVVSGAVDVDDRDRRRAVAGGEFSGGVNSDRGEDRGRADQPVSLCAAEADAGGVDAAGVDRVVALDLRDDGGDEVDLVQRRRTPPSPDRRRRSGRCPPRRPSGNRAPSAGTAAAGVEHDDNWRAGGQAGGPVGAVGAHDAADFDLVGEAPGWQLVPGGGGRLWPGGGTGRRRGAGGGGRPGPGGGTGLLLPAGAAGGQRGQQDEGTGRAGGGQGTARRAPPERKTSHRNNSPHSGQTGTHNTRVNVYRAVVVPADGAGAEKVLRAIGYGLTGGNRQ